MREWIRRWRVLLAGLAAFAAAAGIHGLFHAFDASGRPVPAVAAVPWALAAIGATATVASIIRAWRRRPAIASKLRITAGLVVLLLASLSGVLASDPAFPFGPTYVDSLRLPDGRGTAYLYEGGLFCSQTVRVSPVGSPWSRPEPSVSPRPCRLDGHLQWDPTPGAIEVVDAQGRPLPTAADWGPAFDWRPH